MSIVLSQPTEGEAIKFVASGEELQKDVKSVAKIFDKEAELLLAICGESVYVVGFDTSKSCWLKTNAKVLSGEGCFVILPEVLSGLLNKRSTMTFKFDGTQVSFKQKTGNYAGVMSIQPCSKNSISQLNGIFASQFESTAMPDSTFSALENALKLCNINDSYGEIPQELIRYIHADGENLSITSYDPFHSVLLNTKLEKPVKESFKIAVYHSHFGIINSLARGKGFKIAISDNQFYVKSSQFFLSLPPIQYNSGEYEIVKGLIESMIASEKAASFTIKIADFKNAIQNLYSIYESGSKIEMNFSDGKKAEIKLATSFGAIKDSISVEKAKGKCQILFDAPPINDLLKCLPDKICNFSVLENKAYLLSYKDKTTKVDYIVSLLQN